MSTDWKALCAELTDCLASTTEAKKGMYDGFNGVLARARAALAQPEPLGPSDGEALEMADDLGIIRGHAEHECGLHVACADLAPFARAVITRCGQPTPTPIPVSERLPEAGDCDAEGRCWWGDAGGEQFVPSWRLCDRPTDSHFAHWLPAHDLPLPQEPEPPQ